MLGEWGDWSECGTSCSACDGTGNQVRARSPVTNAENGGIDCSDPTSDEQACTEECPGETKHFVTHSGEHI